MKFFENEQVSLYHGDCIEVIKNLPENFVDSIITDPPYELGFMGKSWDSTGIAFNVEVWREALRLLKPGGHLLAFSGSRTYHRMAVAIEDAGFEIRDQIMWIYGSGFPKSHNLKDDWQGWGTALKPAHEPIVLARKPLIGTVASNVLTYSTGGLNIDASRVGRAQGDDSAAGKRTATFGTQETKSGGDGSGGWEQNEGGRWPANVIHDGSDEVVALFPTSTNVSKGIRGRGSEIFANGKGFANTLAEVGQEIGFGDSGSAARFFYCAKASKRDRNEGLEGFEAKRPPYESYRENLDAKGGDTPFAGAGRSGNQVKNHHPTVKPTDLMRYLIRLITPPDGIVLDPFMGSGSTGKAAIYEKKNFIGIEMTDEYLPIAKARIEFAIREEEGKL
jgi:site-specific DNA-methyltransferase (adenine-specific)